MKKTRNTFNKKTIILLLVYIATISNSFSQQNNAKKLLDDVSSKMTSYTNMVIAFSTSLSNADADIKEGDEAPILGNVILEGEKYNLNYLGSNYIFDRKKLYVINHDEQEIVINDGDFEEDDGFIYPSKLLTFYKEGYNYKLGKLITKKGVKIQYVELTPIDSNSEITKVHLGIDLKKNHIYSLIQTGANGAITTLIITSLKSNQELPKTTFVLDKEAYLKKNYIID